MENLQIQDGSEDKKYFTIIPNFILNHSTANDQALYLQMRRLAGDDEMCYASEKYFRDKLKIGRNAIKNSIKYLLDHKWIKFDGLKEITTKGGKQSIKCYKILDIWQMNINYFKGVSETAHLPIKGVSETAPGGVQNDIEGVLQMTTKKNKEKKNIEEEHKMGAVPAPGNYINKIFDIFYKINSTLNWKNKTQRNAVEEMVKLWGEEKTQKMAEYAVSIHGHPFSPTITTPYQLKLKSSELAAYWKKQNSQAEHPKGITI